MAILRTQTSETFGLNQPWIDLGLLSWADYKECLEDRKSADKALDCDLRVLIRARCLFFPFYGH